MARDMPDFHDLLEFLKKYNFKQVFLWIQLLATHPTNALYLYRFDLLITLLLSITQKEFGGKPFLRGDCVTLCDVLGERYGHLFSSLEDFQPFDQLKLIPFFYKSRKYYFFYGGLERPYELLEQFYNIYLRRGQDVNSPELITIQRYFEESLSFQNTLIKKMMALTETNSKSDIIYVPSQEYFEKLSSHFILERNYPEELKHAIKLTAGKPDWNLQERLPLIPSSRLYPSFIIEEPLGEMFYLWPGRHVEALYTLAKTISSKSSSLNTVLSFVIENARSTVRSFCGQFFTMRGLLTGIFSSRSMKNIARSTDVIAVTDGGKLFLFKIAKPTLRLKLSKSIGMTLSTLKGIERDIRHEELVGFPYVDNPSKMGMVPTFAIEIFMVVVIPRIDLVNVIIVPDIAKDEHVFLVDMTDLQRMLELLPSPLNLVKYLRNEHRLGETTRVFSTDYLDRFICYMDNRESFHRAGSNFTGIMFAPHSWSTYYQTTLCEKYEDPIQELIERWMPGLFDYVKKNGISRYKLRDSYSLTSAFGIVVHKGLALFSLPPNGYFCEGEEIRSAEYLADLLSYNFERFGESFCDILEQHHATLDEFYNVVILPTTFVTRNRLNYLKPELSRINQKTPLVVRTGRISDTHNLRTCVIYEPDKLIPLFEPDDSSGEVYCVREFLKSLLRFLIPHLSDKPLQKQLEIFLQEHLVRKEKAFSYELLPMENPKLDQYHNHSEVSDCDVSRVESEIASYIGKTNIKPGEYKAKEAEYLLSSLYDFLMQKLETELREYGEDLLYYAYWQLELIRGEWEREGTQTGMQANRYIEFNLAQTSLDRRLLLSKASMAVRYLVMLIQKLKLQGSRRIDRERWDYIHALSSTLHNVAIMYEHSKYDICPHSVRLSEVFEIRLDWAESIIDYQTCAYKETERHIRSSQKYYLRRLSVTAKNQDDLGYLTYLQNLDSSFEVDYGFKYQDMLAILYALGTWEYRQEFFFPLNMIATADITKYLQHQIVDPCIQLEVIPRIMQFISIGPDTYEEKGKLNISQIRRRSDRLTLRPVIELPDRKYMFGNQLCLDSARLWVTYLRDGIFPYLLLETTQTRKAVEQYRKKKDNELQQQAEEIAIATVGKYKVEGSIDNFRRLSKNFPPKPSCGEIDLIVINVHIRTLFLLDAKNRTKRQWPYDIRQDINTFLTGKKSYLNKLIQKEIFIKANLREVLKHFSISDIVDWEVRKAFIVPKVYTMAYYKKRSVDFVELENLGAYLQARRHMK